MTIDESQLDFRQKEKMFPMLKHSDKLLVPPTILFKRFQGFYPRGKAAVA